MRGGRVEDGLVGVAGGLGSGHGVEAFEDQSLGAVFAKHINIALSDNTKPVEDTADIHAKSKQQ